MEAIQIAVGNILFTKGMVDCLKEYDIEPPPQARHVHVQHVNRG